jgi:hypothetical protein
MEKVTPTGNWMESLALVAAFLEMQTDRDCAHHKQTEMLQCLAPTGIGASRLGLAQGGICPYPLYLTWLLIIRYWYIPVLTSFVTEIYNNPNIQIVWNA